MARRDRSSPRSRKEGLLARARALAGRGQGPALCELAGEVRRAPIEDRVPLALLVGPALVDALRSHSAVRLHRSVLEDAQPSGESASLHLELARARLELFDVETGFGDLARARAASGPPLPPAREAALLVVEAGLLSHRGEQEEALRLAGKAELLAAACGASDLAVEALLAMSFAALRQGKLDRADEWARNAVERAGERPGMQRADALRSLAVVSANRSDFTPAILSCRQALRIYREHGSQRGQFKGNLTLGTSFLAMGEPDHAELFFQKCLSIAETGEDEPPLSVAFSRMGRVHQVRGDPAVALEHFRKDLELSRKLDNPISRGYPELNLGEALLAMGRPGEARQHLDRARACFSSARHPVGEGMAHLAQARALLADEDGTAGQARLQESGEHLRKARGLMEPLDRTELTCHCDVGEALLLAARGMVEEASRRFEKGASATSWPSRGWWR